MLASQLAGAQNLPGDTVKEHFIVGYRENYFLGGIPLDQAVNKNTADLKFQVSIRTKAIPLPKNWYVFVGYTQISVWNFFAESAPFKDNLYSPGLYFSCRHDNKNTFLTGLEHQSNGRPYYGNPLATEEKDDYSQGMNYAFFQWMYADKGHILSLKLRAGFSAGVGNLERDKMLYTQDLFLYYLGYFTADYRYDWKSFSAHAVVSPIWNKSIANVLVEGEWHFKEGWPCLLLQYHYGFDEALCDCSPDKRPHMNLRLGLSFRMR